MASLSVQGSEGLTLLLQRSGRNTEQSVMSKSTRSAKKFSYGVRTTGGWLVPPSGLTSAPSTGDPGVASWIALLRASRASPSPPPGNEKGPPMFGTSGPMSSALSASPNPQLSFWKTCLEACRISTMSSCPGYKAWATPLRQDSLRRLKSVRRTGGNGSLSWRTPNEALDHHDRGSLQYSQNRVAKGFKVSVADQAKVWMTPGQRDYKDGANQSEAVSTNSLLGRQAPRSGIGGPPSLPDGPTSPHQSKRLRLNPRFAEWLMGLPPGYTGFAPLGTPSFQLRLSLPSVPYWSDE